MSELIARRAFPAAYIGLDLLFLALFAGILLWKRRYLTVLVGFLAGILYFLVDYGIFHLVCHARTITPGYSLFWVLAWMSMSYGFTNFAWIWLWVSKDQHLFEWSLLILLWWFVCPQLAGMFPGGEIVIQRTTGSYHGYMALILLIGYLGLIFWNLREQEKDQKMPISWLLAVGILVQFGWEAGLLIGGIRSAGFTLEEKLRPLIVNSLLETNLGLPYLFAIYIAVTGRFTEQLRRRPEKLTFRDRLREYHHKEEAR